MKICSAFDWETYKEIVNSSNVRCFEVVAELQTMLDFVRVEKEAVEPMMKLGEEGGEVKGHMTFDMCDNFDRAVVSDRIDGASFNEMEKDDDGDISLGSDEEEDEADEEEEDDHEGEEEDDDEEDEEEEEVSGEEDDGGGADVVEGET
ncbi:hypothetical protein BS78_K220600 [Paspalum vaginatum]|uniref:Uncharacterized protein n=1 Tax=Paspalum vaginatum TaxID=158149 RepID=A0A9W7X6X6_9POAL|nr:hypothetical protein BS78_K220600 [Paspalum vaginatum]